jgi:putative sigma-54 modulation protein
MEISIRRRHVAVTPSLKDYARKKVASLADIDFPRIREAVVILDVEKFRRIAEVELLCNSHLTIEAREVSDHLYASIDAVVDKCARQMRKYKTKIQRHRPRNAPPLKLAEQIVPPGSPTESQPASRRRAVRTEKLEVKPMYHDEALLQMELSECQFLVFLKGGQFGLIVPNV